MKILIIEDDRDIAELVEYNLKQEKFECYISANGTHGLDKARREKPDLIVLDLMLPDMGGLDVCRILKSDDKTKNVPIIMLTAKGEEVDRIVGFEVGADDYLTKPFSPRELLLRIKSILKRVKQVVTKHESNVIEFGPIQVDAIKHRVTVQGHEVILTATEFKLLQYLINHRGRVATRDILLDTVWGYDAALTTRTVDTHIKRLRQKMGKSGDYIETIRGIGYRFRETP